MEARRLKDMNLMDDFLCWTLRAHEEFGPKAARYMLSTILQQPLGEVCQRRKDLTQKRRSKMTEIAGFLCASVLTAGST